MWARTVDSPSRPTESQYDIGVCETEAKKSRSAFTSAQCMVIGMPFSLEIAVISLYRASETLRKLAIGTQRIT